MSVFLTPNEPSGLLNIEQMNIRLFFVEGQIAHSNLEHTLMELGMCINQKMNNEIPSGKTKGMYNRSHARKQD
jgi:hypothetical protein